MTATTTQPLRRASTIHCPACGHDKPIGRMTVQVSRTERQVLTECKDCQLRNSAALGIVRGHQRRPHE